MRPTFIAALLLALLAGVGARAQTPGCIQQGGYPWAQNACINPGDLDLALELSIGNAPPQNRYGQGARTGKLWLDTNTSPAILRLCLGPHAGYCSTSYVPDDWKTWFDVDLSSGNAGTPIIGPLGSMAQQNANAVAITGGSITGLQPPQLPLDAATKGYVDALASGTHPHTHVTAATTANLAAAYFNGTANDGVGATLTMGSPGVLVVDTYTPALGEDILVKNQANPAQNGVYTLTTLGTIAVAAVLTRRADANHATSGSMEPGFATSVTQGNQLGAWVMNSPGPLTIGSTALNWVLFIPSASIMVGDSGSGGAAGLVPTPPAGSGGLNYVLSAAGSFVRPSLNMVLNWFGGSLGVANNLALVAFPTGSGGRILTRDGFNAAGDAPGLRFQSETGNCAANGHVNDYGSCVNANDGGSWVALFSAAPPDLREWGAKGNCSFDNGPALTAALALGRPIHLGQGTYVISTTVALTGVYFELDGEGWSEFGLSQAGAPTSGCSSYAGSYLSVTNPSVAAFIFTGNGSGGPRFRNLGVLQKHPAPAAGWAPNPYPPFFTLDGSTLPTAESFFTDIGAGAIYDLVYAKGNSARVQMDNIYGQVFHNVFQVDNAFDVSKAHNWHIWPFWSQDQNVMNWQHAHMSGFFFRRQDSFQADGIFILGAQACVVLSSQTGPYAGPPTAIHFGNLNCDSTVYPVWVDGNSNGAVAAIDHFWVGGENCCSNFDPLPGSNAIQIDGKSARIDIGDIDVTEVQGSIVNITNTVAGSILRFTSIDASTGINYSGTTPFQGTLPVFNVVPEAPNQSEISVLHPIQPQNAGYTAGGVTSGFMNLNSDSILYAEPSSQAAWYNATIANGSNTAWPNWAQTLLVSPSGPISAATLALPVALDGREATLVCNNSISSLAVIPYALDPTATIVNYPTNCPIGSHVTFKFNNTLNKWYAYH